MGRTAPKASLLGDCGEQYVVTGTSSSASRAARLRRVPPQHEYPIFTPGFREPDVYPDPSRQSFQEMQPPPLQEQEAQGVWKEIHTDTQSIDDEPYSAPAMPTNRGHIYHARSHTNTASPGQIFLMPALRSHNSPPPDYLAPPAEDPTLGAAAILAPGRISISPRSKYLLPAASPGDSSSYILPGRHTSPANAGISHSPQNVNILSPRLLPLQKSPKLTQLNITSPKLTEIGGLDGLTPMISQLATSPDFAKGLSNLSDAPMSSTMQLPPAKIALSSPVSSVKSTKLLKARHKDTHAPPRASHSKDRSPGREWKKTLQTMSPGLSSLKDEAQNAMRGIARDLGNSLSGSKGRASAAAAGCVNSTPAPSWTRCGDGQSMVAPAVERDSSGSSSDSLELPTRVTKKQPSAPKELKSGSHYNIFSFLHWGKKKNNAAKLNESFESEIGSVKADSESIKVLDYTIKTLRYKLEQANKKRETAVNEVRALQSAMEVMEEKCKQLQQKCQDLELQLGARPSDFWDAESESENPKYIVGRRDGNAGLGLHGAAAAAVSSGGCHFPSSLEITPQLFSKMFEDSKVTLRKLASAICHHIRDSGESATQVITSLLEQHKVGRWVSRMPRNVIILYFESFLNQVMFESFENVSFEPNGAATVFDTDALKQASFKSYQDLRKQEWASIEKSLGKAGAVVVNANFHRFFVVRMELILSQLGKLAENDIPLPLMAAFFNAVKSVWLVHHLAFAFDSPVTLFRVAPAADFDPRFMEQVTTFEEEPIRSKISIMVNPGFIVNRQTIKCQVFCSSKYQ